MRAARSLRRYHLARIAATDSYKLNLKIPESRVEPVHAGLSGAFASFADPNRRVAFQITRMNAAAELEADGSIVVAEALLSENVNAFLPGMEGVARIDVGSRPVRWVLFHRIVDYLRVNFWL